MLRELTISILGVIENMSAVVCPHCDGDVPLFPDAAHDPGERFGAPRLGRIPFDPRIAACGDGGVPLTVAHPDSPSAVAFHEIARGLTRGDTAAGHERQPFTVKETL
jgi:ATP-binding protein involved in chromosome partitioning